MAEEVVTSAPAALPFLATANQHLWPLVIDDVYREFTSVSHIGHPCPLPPDAGSETTPSRFGPSFRTGYFVGGLIILPGYG